MFVINHELWLRHEHKWKKIKMSYRDQIDIVILH